jgi:hypothetical protein
MLTFIGTEYTVASGTKTRLQRVNSLAIAPLQAVTAC